MKVYMKILWHIKQGDDDDEEGPDGRGPPQSGGKGASARSSVYVRQNVNVQ